MHRMSDEVLSNLMQQLMEQSTDHVSIAWQGGEPTLMGLSFYKNAVVYQQKFGHGQRVANAIQTNGILLTADWMEFFTTYRFLVGLSLDGPQNIHDFYRLHGGGKGSWKKVDQVARELVRNQVAVNSLSVVSNYSVEHVEEIYTYLKSIGFEHLQFIPLVETDHGKAAGFSVDAVDYGRFLCKLFDLWYEDYRAGLAPSIRYFESVFHLYVSLPAPLCTLSKTCGSYVVAEHNGDIYSCDFYVEPGWKLGNIENKDLIDMLNSGRQTLFGNNKQTDLPVECHQCEWLNYCQGGCPKDRKNDPRTVGSNYFCQSYKLFFAHADERLSDLAEQWKAAHKA